MPEISLYIHIPFCGAKCDYCDFYSIPLDYLGSERNSFINRYLDALLAETERRLGEAARQTGGPVSVPSVYIGGGTPSLLGADGIVRLLDGLAGIRRPASEITVEANPESADAAFLSACAAHGVTRLSLGVQSFDAAARKALGRQGGAELLPERLKAASGIFGGGLSLDVMTGLPGQSAAAVRLDVERALSYRPGHISLYALTPEAGTPLAARLESLPAEDKASRLWLAGRDALLRRGYEQYEVSNFALQEPGACFSRYRCAHNIRYWRMENWIGVGPAASGTLIVDEKAPRGKGGARGERVSYRPDVEAFLADPASCRVTEELDNITLIKETLLMGFRYAEGPDLRLFKRRFGVSLEETIPRTLETWKGFLQPRSTEKIALTGRGLLFLNRFLRDSFAELEK